MKNMQKYTNLCRIAKTSQWVQVLATKPDSVDLIPGTCLKLSSDHRTHARKELLQCSTCVIGRVKGFGENNWSKRWENPCDVTCQLETPLFIFYLGEVMSTKKTRVVYLGETCHFNLNRQRQTSLQFIHLVFWDRSLIDLKLDGGARLAGQSTSESQLSPPPYSGSQGWTSTSSCYTWVLRIQTQTLMHTQQALS